MMTHPDVLAKAQQEIDEVVGSDRLPTLDDRPFLPYRSCSDPLLALQSDDATAVDAILNETYRWGVPVPLGERVADTSACMRSADPVVRLHLPGLPHRLMEDDIYRGMHIPKGSMVRCTCIYVNV